VTPELIASGRASDVFDLGDGRVLRRFKGGGDPSREALVMEHARNRGYLVPRVLEVADDSLVLERVDGRTMEAELRRRPWAFRRYASLLARLHDELHAIAAPPGLRAYGSGDRLLHLDLHPGNVIVSPTGPVVIDWTNAHRGEPALDVALTWIILATSGGPAGRVFLHWFLPCFDRDSVVRALPRAAQARLADPNVSDAERRAVRRLVVRAGARLPNGP
jgi:streptomycin 6-kinase